MIVPNEAISVAVVVVPGTSSSSALAAVELVSSAGRPWQLPGSVNKVTFSAYLIAESETVVTAPPDIDIVRLSPNRESPIPEAVFIPEIRLDSHNDVRGPGWPVWHDWLRRCHARGAVISSASTGVAMLADAGLLNDCTANSHWATTRLLQQRYPSVRFSGSESLVSADASDSIIMAGAGAAWSDLALTLIARFAGREAALQTARVNLLQWQEFGQRPFREPLTGILHKDAAISKAIAWLHENFTQAAPISLAVEQAGLPERTFTRRFHVATGASPLEYVHQLRLNRARRLLESSSLSIQVVANNLGYEDPSFFSRLFKREVGLTPAQYRKRFSPIFEALPECTSTSQPLPA